MKKYYFVELFKRFFWTSMDYILQVILISFLWFLFNIPFLWLFIMFLYTGVTVLFPYLVIIIIIFYSPISFGASYYVLQIVSQYFESKKFRLFSKYYSPSEIKISIFFKGIRKYFLKSLLLILLNLIVSLFLYLNFIFYWRIIVPNIPLIGLFLTGIVFWATIIYLLVLNYVIPIIISKDINVFKAVYQSFLLVIDNLFYTMGATLFLISFMVILIFTIAGFVLIFYGIFSIFQITSMLIIYQKYDETLQLRDEKRKLKNIIKPWD